MLYLARAPARATRWCRLLAVRALLTILGLAMTIAESVGRRWQEVRRSRDAGVESVEIAIGLALGLALALVVWAAYKALTTKYLNQVQ